MSESVVINDNIPIVVVCLPQFGLVQGEDGIGLVLKLHTLQPEAPEEGMWIRSSLEEG